MTVPAGAYPADFPVVLEKRNDLVKRAPGVPIGISFLGRRFGEAALIGFAFAFEQASVSAMMVSTLISTAHARERLRHAEGVELPRTQLSDLVAR